MFGFHCCRGATRAKRTEWNSSNIRHHVVMQIGPKFRPQFSRSSPVAAEARGDQVIDLGIADPRLQPSEAYLKNIVNDGSPFELSCIAVAIIGRGRSDRAWNTASGTRRFRRIADRR